MKTILQITVASIQRNPCGWLALGVALLAGGGACSTPPRARAPYPPAAHLNVPLGTVGIISTSSVPWFHCQRPKIKGKDGRYELGPGFGESCFWLGMDRDRFRGIDPNAAMMVVGPMLAAGVVGQFAGMVHDGIYAMQGIPLADLVAADAAVDRFISETSFQEILRTSVETEAQRRSSHPVTAVKKPLPQGPERELAKLIRVKSGTLAWLPPGETPRSYLLGQAIDTVLEIQIHKHGLEGKAGTNSDLHMMADVTVRLVRVQDGVELHSSRLSHRSPSRKYTDWAKDDAAALRSAVPVSCQSLARKIVEDLWPAPTDLVAFSKP